MLEIRKPRIYGTAKLETNQQNNQKHAEQIGQEVDFFQSNFEGEIVDKIQESLGQYQGIIINPAAYSHTSVAVRDAISAVGLPTIEVHISNIHAREEFRQNSLTAGACSGVIAGFGPMGYHLALQGISQILNEIQAIRQAREAQAKQQEQ